MLHPPQCGGVKRFEQPGTTVPMHLDRESNDSIANPTIRSTDS
jgi:hypothetical protein